MAAATLCGFCWTKLIPLAVSPASLEDRIMPELPADQPEPGRTELRRSCPTCGKQVMAAATRCGFCWAKLVPFLP